MVGSLRRDTRISHPPLALSALVAVSRYAMEIVALRPLKIALQLVQTRRSGATEGEGG